MNGAERRTSPWVWVAAGCGGALLLGVVALLAIGYFAYRKAKDFEAEMKDPQARQAKVLRVLGAETLPPGYYAVIGMSVPFVWDMAMLSDQPADTQGRHAGLGKRGFIYVRTLSAGRDREQMRDYFEGRGEPPEALRRQGIRIEREDLLRRGTVDVAGQHVLYMAQRGHLAMGGAERVGITTTMLVECPADRRQRMGFWFGPDPEVGRPAAELDLSGTPADEDALREFMSHFRLCGS